MTWLNASIIFLVLAGLMAALAFGGVWIHPRLCRQFAFKGTWALYLGLTVLGLIGLAGLDLAAPYWSIIPTAVPHIDCASGAHGHDWDLPFCPGSRLIYSWELKWDLLRKYEWKGYSSFHGLVPNWCALALLVGPLPLARAVDGLLVLAGRVRRAAFRSAPGI
jgi:hypothetical protein